MIEQAVWERAKTDAGIQSMLGDPPRVYPLQAPQSVVAPYIVYQRASGAVEHLMGVDSGLANPRIQFTLVGRTPLECWTLADRLRAAFNRWRGVTAGILIQDSLLDSEFDHGFEEVAEVYQRTMDFLVWHI
jgi:hypothetical protein